ncbi:MAG TPA: DUF72 domain-containing protein [Gemmatimonadaceae bacterium]|nr:DUF72 domain-containing protein [Gemmatimonadaceae bacterium]
MPSRLRTFPSFPAPDLDAPHDPGPGPAGDRGERAMADDVAGRPIPTETGGRVLVGTASWTDPTILGEGVFYPAGVSSAEDRLRYYASRFPLVEVDSTYYALPARRMAELWVERTPDDFTFNVKAHALMTGQPTEVARLPRELREALPPALAAAQRVYAKDLPPELYDEVWRVFLDAIEPLRSSGKLGAVLLQYPRWFVPTPENRDLLLDAKQRLGDVPGAVELRNRRWFGEDRDKTERTLAFLERHGFPFVMVDGPQGLESSVPPVAAVTSPRLAILRLHGRRAETWEKRGVATVERYRYLYDPAQLEDWAPKIADAAAEAKEVHILFNNCYANYGTTNAAEMMRVVRKEGLGS